MCRAAGRSSIPDARRLMMGAVLAIESRGPHATGFGWADEIGHPWFWKMPGRASDVARFCQLPTGLRTAIGHTRWATHGDPAVNENNHPVVAPGLVLVHNGVLTNHAELFRDLGVTPETEVDSEALAALLGYGPTVHTKAQSAADLLAEVRGDAAIAWLDAEDPMALQLARLRGRPMTLGWTKRNDLVMSSTRATLALTAKLAKLEIRDVLDVPEGTYLRIEGGRTTERLTVKLPPKVYSWQRPVTPTPPPRPPKRKGKGSARRPGLVVVPDAGTERFPDDRWAPAWLRGDGVTRVRSEARRKRLERTVHDGLIERLPEWRASQIEEE